MEIIKYELRKAVVPEHLADDEKIYGLFDDIIESCAETQLLETFSDKQSAKEALKGYICQAEVSGAWMLVTVYCVNAVAYDEDDDITQAWTVARAAYPDEITLSNKTYRHIGDGDYERL